VDEPFQVAGGAVLYCVLCVCFGGVRCVVWGRCSVFFGGGGCLMIYIIFKEAQPSRPSPPKNTFNPPSQTSHNHTRTITRASPATNARPFLSLVTFAPAGHTSSSSSRSLSKGPSTGSGGGDDDDESATADVPPSVAPLPPAGGGDSAAPAAAGPRSSRMHASAPSKYAASAAPPSLADATMLYGCRPTVRTSELSNPRPGLATSHSRCREGSAVSRRAISRAAGLG
jgi:hypothetical protein